MKDNSGLWMIVGVWRCGSWVEVWRVEVLEGLCVVQGLGKLCIKEVDRKEASYVCSSLARLW